MKIRMYTDYACPFCMIQKEMIKEAGTLMNEEFEVEQVFMEIHPEVPEGGARPDEVLPADYIESTNGKLRHYGEEYGLVPTLNEKMSNSKRAQLVRGFIKVNEERAKNFRTLGMEPVACKEYEGKLGAYDEACYKAYNLEGRDIGSYEVLDEILASIGIGYPAKEMCMDSRAHAEYEKDKKECYDKGIRITPTLEIEGRLYPGLNKPEKINGIIAHR